MIGVEVGHIIRHIDSEEWEREEQQGADGCPSPVLRVAHQGPFLVVDPSLLAGRREDTRVGPRAQPSPGASSTTA